MKKETVPNSIPDPRILQNLADLFKIFGDPTRIRILCALSDGELCVCDIASILDLSLIHISEPTRP